MPKTDRALPENTKESLDRKLDHAIEETFPTSDPVSVTITKGGAIDYGREGTPDALLDQARDTLQGAVETATDAAREAYRQGQRYVRDARERYPAAERYYREGTQAVREQAAENPLLTALVGFGFGFALAWLIKSSRADDSELPDYARTRSRYEPQTRT